MASPIPFPQLPLRLYLRATSRIRLRCECNGVTKRQSGLTLSKVSGELIPKATSASTSACAARGLKRAGDARWVLAPASVPEPNVEKQWKRPSDKTTWCAALYPPLKRTTAGEFKRQTKESVIEPLPASPNCKS